MMETPLHIRTHPTTTSSSLSMTFNQRNNTASDRISFFFREEYGTRGRTPAVDVFASIIKDLLGSAALAAQVPQPYLFNPEPEAVYIC